MKSSQRAIFRPEAVQRYTEARERSVLPVFISPQIMVAFWALVALLIFGGAVLWFAKTPVYASGSAIVATIGNDSANLVNVEEGTVLLVLLPDEAKPALGQSKTVLVQVDASGKPLEREIIAFEKDASRVKGVLQELGLDIHPAVAQAQPAALAVARPENMPAADSLGAVFRAEMEVGSQRIASLLPFMDQIL